MRIFQLELGQCVGFQLSGMLGTVVNHGEQLNLWIPSPYFEEEPACISCDDVRIVEYDINSFFCNVGTGSFYVAGGVRFQTRCRPLLSSKRTVGFQLRVLSAIPSVGCRSSRNCLPDVEMLWIVGLGYS